MEKKTVSETVNEIHLKVLSSMLIINRSKINHKLFLVEKNRKFYNFQTNFYKQ